MRLATNILTTATPWAIRPADLRALREKAQEHAQAMRSQYLAGGITLSFSTEEEPERLVNDNGIGVINVQGVMVRNPDWFDRIFYGATDLAKLEASVRAATNDDSIEALFLNIDSPGGTVNGTYELAHAIAECSKKKYVYAFSAGDICSAAYWIASQCDAIYVTPSATVGSIGVIWSILDMSEAYASAGVKVEVFASGEYKGAGLEGTSLTDSQRALFKAGIDELAEDFRAAVLKRGRKIPLDAMQGQTFTAKTAQRLNMAGTVNTRDEVMTRLRTMHTHGAKSGGKLAQLLPHG